MSPPPVVPITWAALHPQPEEAPAATCAVCWSPLCEGVAPGDVLLCEWCGVVWLHYTCWLRLPTDAAVTARLGARAEALFAELAERADEDLDRMAELAAEIEVPGRLVALCVACRS